MGPEPKSKTIENWAASSSNLDQTIAGNVAEILEA